MKKLLAYLLPVLVLLFSCTSPVQYPPEPQIDFLQLNVKDTVDNSELQSPIVLYQIIFKVLDGDNNFGLLPGDTTGIYSPDTTYYNNLFITLLYKNNGRFDTADLPLSLNYRIPAAEIVSIHDYFKATVIIDLSFDPNVISSMFDTIKFSFYVVDKDLNPSNIQETPEIPTDFRGTVVDTVTIIQ